MDRRLLLGLGAATALVFAAASLFRPEGERRASFAPGALAFPDLAVRLREAASIEIRRGDRALRLRRDGDEWRIIELHEYRARTALVREILAGLAELRLIEEGTADPVLLERIGLDEASATRLILRDAEGAAIADLLLGRRRLRTYVSMPGGGLPERIAVRRPGEARSWLAEGRLAVTPEPEDWLDRDLADIPPARLRRVEILRPGEPPLLLSRDPSGEHLLAITAPADAPPADRTALDQLGRAFEGLTFETVRPAAGLAGESLGEARFALDSGAEITAKLYQDGQMIWTLLDAGGDAEAAHWARRWQGWAYRLAAGREVMLPRLADLLAR
jgi:hypothetical protein